MSQQVISPDPRTGLPRKRELPAMLIAPGAVHTGDGWMFTPRADGGLDVTLFNPLTGGVVRTELTAEEWGAVQRAATAPAEG